MLKILPLLFLFTFCLFQIRVMVLNQFGVHEKLFHLITCYISYYVFNLLLKPVFQMTQLLLCDWLLETRTSLWEDSVEGDSTVVPVSNSFLSAFQRDLTSLKTVTQHIIVSCKNFLDYFVLI